MGFSHCANDFVFEGYAYHFPEMIEALRRGPDYNDHVGLDSSDDFIGVPTPVDPTMPIEFLGGYQGTIDAYNQLFYDVARVTDTNYLANGYIKTDPLKALGLYHKSGLEIGGLRFGYDLDGIVNSIYNGYIVNLWINYDYVSDEVTPVFPFLWGICFQLQLGAM